MHSYLDAEQFTIWSRFRYLWKYNFNTASQQNIHIHKHFLAQNESLLYGHIMNAYTDFVGHIPKYH